MVPQLTSGAIQRILNGEPVQNAVVQLLGCKKIPGTGNDRFRLLISDGVTGCPFGMLGTQLNHMVAKNELEKFTIIRMDKQICNQVHADRKVIIILELTVLMSGAEVGEKIGNPINSSTASTNSEALANSNTYNRNVQNNCPETNAQISNISQPSGFSHIYPINTLTPYQNKWTIKVRVTSKTPIRTWSNSRGEGKLFSMNLIDESGEIRATAFNDAVDKFYEMLEVNKIYYISKATLKSANTKYTSIKNDYEMTFNNETAIKPCEENASEIPMLQFNFIPIAQIENVDKDASIDVIGVCKYAGEIQNFIARTTNKEMVKRDIRLVDRSNKEVSLTLWGQEAEKFDGSMNPVIAIKSARVSDFNGRSLSVSASSIMQINPDIKEAHILKGWYDHEGCNLELQSISGKAGIGTSTMGGQWKTFAQVVGEQLGMGDKPDYYINKATVVMVRKENCMYMACPSEECNKKVVDMNNGLYRCEKCNREYDNFKWRLLLSINVADYSGNQWVTCFQEAAESILNATSSELGSLKEADEEQYNQILSNANFKSYIFKFRVKMETFNEESRLKTTVVTVTSVDDAIFGRKLLADIKQLSQSL